MKERELRKSSGLIKHHGTNHLFIWHKCSNAKLTSAQKRRHTEVNLYSDEDTSTQSSPIKTRRASLETAAKFLTSDDIKWRLFCEQEGTCREMVTVKSGLVSRDTTVLRNLRPEYDSWDYFCYYLSLTFLVAKKRFSFCPHNNLLTKLVPSWSRT